MRARSPSQLHPALVRGALAGPTVELVTEIPAGDHVLTLLRAIHLHRGEAQWVLVFFGSGAHRIADPLFSARKGHLVTDNKMILGMALSDGYGNMSRAWRAPNVDPANYVAIEANIRYAQAAERGKFAFLFTPDFPAVRGNVDQVPTRNIIDPLIALTAISQATSRIGFVATGSTTFQEPFNQARQFKALDVLSHGRAG